MRRSFLARVLHTVVAIVFALAVTEPVTLHACPIHDGVSVAGATGHAMHHASATSMPSDEHGSTSHQCACMGDCAGTAPAALVPVRLTLASVALIDTLRATGVPHAAQTVGPVPHALPFANGPPSSRLA